MKILLVEGNRDLTKSLEGYIVSLGHQVEVAFDGAQAVSAISKNSFDALVMNSRIARVSADSVATRFFIGGGKRVVCITDDPPHNVDGVLSDKKVKWLETPFSTQKLKKALTEWSD